MTKTTRTERDSMGPMEVPADAYYGASPQRVIANRASELLGGARASRLVHPNDHVNLGQSSNDVIPTAIHLAALVEMQERLAPALERLREALAAKAQEFWGIVKTGRTHIQDATPIRLRQAFRGYTGPE